MKTKTSKSRKTSSTGKRAHLSEPATPAVLTPFGILSAILRSESSADAFPGLLREAEARLPGLAASQFGFNACDLRDVAFAMCDATDDLWPEAIAAYRPIEDEDGVMEKVSIVIYSTALASFALGLVAGVKFGGAR